MKEYLKPEVEEVSFASEIITITDTVSGGNDGDI
jgi:hypothetical protein